MENRSGKGQGKLTTEGRGNIRRYKRKGKVRTGGAREITQ